MNNVGIEKLKTIGAQKIHEQTHIPIEHVQSILHESFESLNKIQFLGFLSILEREYKVSLSDIRNNGTKYFNELPKKTDEESKNGIFIVSKEKKVNNKNYIFAIVLIVVMTIFYVGYNNSSSTTNAQIENFSEEKQINDLEENKTLLITQTPTQTENLIESNQTQIDENLSNVDNNQNVLLDANESEVKIIQNDTNLVATKEHTVKIFPKSKLWMGYIELSTNNHYQTVFSDQFDLNTSNDWLLALGHGSVDIEVDGGIQQYRTKDNLRFLYQNHEFKQITTDEFKALNKGKKW